MIKLVVLLALLLPILAQNNGGDSALGEWESNSDPNSFFATPNIQLNISLSPQDLQPCITRSASLADNHVCKPYLPDVNYTICASDTLVGPVMLHFVSFDVNNALSLKTMLKEALGHCKAGGGTLKQQLPPVRRICELMVVHIKEFQFSSGCGAVLSVVDGVNATLNNPLIDGIPVNGTLDDLAQSSQIQSQASTCCSNCLLHYQTFCDGGDGMLSCVLGNHCSGNETIVGGTTAAAGGDGGGVVGESTTAAAGGVVETTSAAAGVGGETSTAAGVGGETSAAAGVGETSSVQVATASASFT